MVSKTQKRQLRKSVRENSPEETVETPNATINARNTIQNTGNFGLTLSDADIDTLIRNAVEREMIRFDISNNTNNIRNETTQSCSRTNNRSETNMRSGVNEVSRAAHIIADHGNHESNWVKRAQLSQTDCSSKTDQNRSGKRQLSHGDRDGIATIWQFEKRQRENREQIHAKR